MSDGIEYGLVGRLRQPKVDETGAGNFGGGDKGVGAGLGNDCIDDLLCQLSRVAPGGFGKLHGDVGGEVAVAGDLGSL